MAEINEIINSSGNEETALVLSKLWDFMNELSFNYTKGESSSVSSDEAERMMSSLFYLLNIDSDDFSNSSLKILKSDIKEMYAQALIKTDKKVKSARQKWMRLCVDITKLHNISLYETVKNIGGFFKNYNMQYFAADIPCDIDYQLAVPVSEKLKGVDYIDKYITYLLIENRYINLFPENAEIELLKKYCADYRGLVINLFEPIITNALGLFLVKGDVLSLNINTKQCDRLISIFGDKQSLEIKNLLKETSKLFVNYLGITSVSDKAYIFSYAQKLAPRIETAVNHGGMDGIFIEF